MDPALKDNRCPDVETAHSLLKHCMSNHRFGLAALLLGRGAARRVRDALHVRQVRERIVKFVASRKEEERLNSSAGKAGKAGTVGKEGKAKKRDHFSPAVKALKGGAWAALPTLVQRTYLLEPDDYAEVSLPARGRGHKSRPFARTHYNSCWCARSVRGRRHRGMRALSFCAGLHKETNLQRLLESTGGR